MESLRRFENLDAKVVELISDLLRDEDWMIRSIAVEKALFSSVYVIILIR